MYNSIYPVNINYRNHAQYKKDTEGNSNVQTQTSTDEFKKTDDSSNQKKLYYTKGNINISQILADFRNTIAAINAPLEVGEEVGAYLNLVEKESLKENPSKEIVLSNLKNASKISDNYISQTLNKSSNVVENWITTLFKQPINLKANPDEINPDFLLKFPQKTDNIQSNNTELQAKNVEEKNEEVKISSQFSPDEAEVQNSFDIYDDENDNAVAYNSAFTPKTEADIDARELFILAKNAPDTNEGDIEAINMLNDALGLLAQSNDSNQNIKAAIHLERGKLFDTYDYVDYALRDYYEATKADDLNLKAQAFYKSGQIYDEFSEFYPALDNYLSSVAYSGEADNLSAQAKVLTKISSMYTKQYDIESASNYSDLALISANSSEDNITIADTYSTSAQNYQYLGENEKALDNYKQALKAFSRDDESYEEMAYNYEQAAIVMEQLGNRAKANKLQLKANLYYQKAQQFDNELAIAG